MADTPAHRPVLAPFDAQQDMRDAPRVGSGSRMRPKDAATVIIVRDRSSASGLRTPSVLMGRRAAGHVFMASKWVFPGGRIERADHRAASATDLEDRSAALLGREVSPSRARALALAAVRETFEETGLVLGRAAPVASVGGPWREFRALGALPDLSALDYVARAITPPGRTRRFDARFFMADAETLMSKDQISGSGELDEIAWIPLDEARALELPAITRFVLAEVAERLHQPDRPLPFVRMVAGKHVVSYD